ncbi:MAG: cation:proton antiporter [Bacteroidetes bacterium]|nr:cation:proton antiporter [Bacteroidota bacterium]
MVLLFDLTIPFTNPVLIFTLVLLIILFAPFIFRKLKIPGIVGLILAGVAVGPYGLNLLAENSSMNLLGSIGLLYLMFLAGLEIDLRDFRINRNTSLVFGSLTFFVPLILGFFVSYFILNFKLLASLLLASMFSTQTLISYPIISRLGIIKNRAVQITIGGTIITDTAVLLLLAIIMALRNGELTAEFWLRLVVSLIGFVIAVLWIIPKISRWFLKYLEGESSSQYIYVLLVVFVSALFSQIANVEPIIGAFLAGLALNKLIPHSSALMNRILFIGNTLFIPFFLLSVGMLVNLNVLFNGAEAVTIAAILVVTAQVTKYTAAYITQKIFNYTRDERHVIYGLSTSHAAATIAIILVGYKAGMVNDAILNGTILVILTSCLISSFFTEIAGRKLAVTETNKKISLPEQPERIIVPISNPVITDKMLEFALFIKDPDSSEPIHPLTVLPDDDTAKDIFFEQSKILENAVKNTTGSPDKVALHTRVDLNIANGISRAVKELMATTIIFGWSRKVSTTNYFFGSIIDNLLRKTKEMIIVFKPLDPLFLIKKITVIAPPNAELEIGFSGWIKVVVNLSRQTNSEVIFFGQLTTLENIKTVISKTKAIKSQYKEFENMRNLFPITKNIEPSDLFVIINGRPRTISYNRYLAITPRQLAKTNNNISFAVIYPEQKAIFENTSVNINEVSAGPIEDNIERINKLGKYVKKVITKKKRK